MMIWNVDECEEKYEIKEMAQDREGWRDGSCSVQPVLEEICMPHMNV